MYGQSEKTVKQLYLIHMSSQYGELRLTGAQVISGVLGTPANFNRFRVLASLLHRRRSPEANQTLHDLWPSPELVHYIHFVAFDPWWNFARCKIHFSSKSCVLLYWQRYWIGTPAAGVIQTLRRATRNRTFAEGATYIPPWLPTFDSIRGFAHAAGFAAARRCLRFLVSKYRL